MRRVFFAGLVAALAGCGTPPAATVREAGTGHDDHDHDRDKLMLADAGPYHAGLTAHLSPDGNELDVLFETVGADPKPVPLVLGKFTATAITAAGKVYELAFEPAPKAERPGDPEGKCSHFVAKAGWMAAGDVLKVTAEVEINGKHRRVVWKNFEPRKYAHAGG